MPDFPLQYRVQEYRSDSGVLVRAKRAYLLCEFVDLPIPCDAFLDTAAPFSIVPYTFAQQVPWQLVATTLTRAGVASPSALLWQGIPCELETVSVRIVHPATGIRSAPFTLLAKFPKRAAPGPLERALVLGLALLDDQDVQLTMARVAGTLTGTLTTP
jgi:hypothetical protein